jgi:hypothetical protein
MSIYAQYLSTAGAWGFRASRTGDLTNERGDLIQIMGDRARLFLKDGRNFTLYTPARLADLLRRLYVEPAESDPPELTLF